MKKKLISGEWIQVRMQDIKIGDKFRLFDGDRPVEDNNKSTIFTAWSNAFLNEDNIWCVDVR